MSAELKTKVAKDLAGRIQNGWIIGIGTGSTVSAAIIELARRVKTENLKLHLVTTSYDSARLLSEQGLSVLDASTVDAIDFGFDGVDFLDSNLNAIKGKGAAMLREKIMAAKCNKYVYICDQSKVVASLSSCEFPVEVIPEALGLVKESLKKLGAATINLRSGTGKFGGIVTELGNLILDCTFLEMNAQLEQAIKAIVGVVESGLFYNYAEEAIVAYPDKISVLTRKS